ncbi:DUF6503 family protein [Winogradskyella immobilis]|uniref:Aspartyl-tRNA synthetase n=1 Tax=Winogradskyella immobilis TaxID=2816852 RepID=A0ABS8EPX1_9FLAO|nr:DUF6503 family protein [Winogradskyella immobilis]MCC1484362.1 hypothetical protein [Winogradskyella immobilis]MCG0016454.1 DUF6503 family protein [Winogradskyella immobilis]
MKNLILITLIIFNINSYSQTATPSQLLDKAIAYHDPNGHWQTFNDSFNVTMTTQNANPRESKIIINLLHQYYSVAAKRDGTTTTYTMDKGKCIMSYNGAVLDEVSAKAKGMTCDRAELYKNYYSYLYGLPMKLKDKGTHLGDKIERKTFKGKDYLVLKATYDASVGSDEWYFYFNPKTYAMEVYQFYKTDDNGNVIPDSGEYILLSEEAIVSGIKMPKVRAWYYNKDDKYLGTDTLVEK